MWHLEFDSLVVLKNNKGTEESRVRKLDHCFQLNRTMYERLVNDQDITLFSPADVPGLYDAFIQDQELFAVLYKKYEADKSIRKVTKKASEVFAALMIERQQTGRVYIQNIDHVNDHGSFKPEVAPIEQSNLCAEIALPTKPLENIDDENGVISLCTLAAINWGNFKNPEDMEEACELSVRALDALLDYQDYPIIAAERSTMGYRPLGVGIINFAYFLAKRGLRYDSTALDTVHEWTEAWSYYLLKASVTLAKEKGACEYLANTKYGDGILPIDTYKKSVDDLLTVELKQDWEGLRSEMKEHGIRNATLMALMPSESSSQISNSTSGIDAPRSLVTFKNSKDGVLPQVVPEIEKLKNKYDLLWEQPDNKGPIMIAAVLQKFIDQSISFNTNYVQTNYPDNKIPMKLLLEDLLMAYKLGHKNWYYCNTNDASGELDVSKMVDDNSTVQLPSAMQGGEDDCDSCKI